MSSRKSKEYELPIKTVRYKDELGDEFSRAQITPKKIGNDYNYLPKNPFWRLGRFIAYRLIATPIAFLFTKIHLRHTVKNKRVLKSVGKSGYFLFGNHTQEIGDAFIPHMAIFPKSAYTVVHPNNVSMPVLGRFTPALGALPLPDSIKGLRAFSNAIEKRLLEGNAIVVYPEAHIWPYCTWIRSFPSTAMKYPVDFNEASFTMTTVYKKRKSNPRPRAVTYVDGPFYPNMNLPPRERAKELRDRLYAQMVERSKESDCEYIRYVKESED